MPPADDHLPQPQPQPQPQSEQCRPACCAGSAGTAFLTIHAGGVHIVVERVPRWLVAVATASIASFAATAWGLPRR